MPEPFATNQDQEVLRALSCARGGEVFDLECEPNDDGYAWDGGASAAEALGDNGLRASDAAAGAGDRGGLRVGIVADDFTSAMDAAAPFAAVGAVGVAIVTTGNGPIGAAELLAVDTDSRRGGVREAADRTAAAVAELRRAEVLVKTVDSTLRGHPAAEIEAAGQAAERERIVLAPAFPGAGRTTSGGVQLVDGIEVSATAFGSDRRHPVRSGSVSSLLGAAPVQRWAPGDGPLADRGPVIADAAADADLDRLLAAAGPLERTLWVGSPGLAAALARKLGASTAGFVPRAPRAARVAVVVGSTHPVNAAQLERLEERLGDEVTRHDDVGARVAIVAAPPAGHSISAAAAERMGGALAERARKLVEAGFDGLIATGGETARALVEALGGGSVEVLDEPSPGVVAARIADSGLALVTKAGGFGDAETLVGLRGYLAGAPAR